MGTKALTAASGKMLTAPSGKAAGECGCCGVTCGGCDNIPQFISVTFANITNCGADVPGCCGTCTDLNAEWIIETTGDCLWEEGILQIDFTCESYPYIGVEAYLDGDDTKIRILAVNRSIMADYCFDNGWAFSVGDLWDCTFPVVINNDNVCAGSILKCIGTAGTATIDRV